MWFLSYSIISATDNHASNIEYQKSLNLDYYSSPFYWNSDWLITRKCLVFACAYHLLYACFFLETICPVKFSDFSLTYASNMCTCIHICMYIAYMYTYIAYMYTCMYVYVGYMYTCMYVCIYSIHVLLYVYTLCIPNNSVNETQQFSIYELSLTIISCAYIL